MKYNWGYIISTGQPKREFIDLAKRHVHMRQGVLGVRVKIFCAEQRNNKDGVRVLPDMVTIKDPKNDFKNVQTGTVGSRQVTQN